MIIKVVEIAKKASKWVTSHLISSSFYFSLPCFSPLLLLLKGHLKLLKGMVFCLHRWIEINKVLPTEITAFWKLCWSLVSKSKHIFLDTFCKILLHTMKPKSIKSWKIEGSFSLTISLPNKAPQKLRHISQNHFSPRKPIFTPHID